PSAKQLKHSKPKRIMKRTGRKKQTMPKSAAPPSSKGKSVILKQPSINSLALSRNLCLSPTPMHKLQHTRGPRHLPAREASNSQHRRHSKRGHHCRKSILNRSRRSIQKRRRLHERQRRGSQKQH